MQLQNLEEKKKQQTNKLKQTQAKASEYYYKKQPNQITKTRKPIHRRYLQ